MLQHLHRPPSLRNALLYAIHDARAAGEHRRRRALYETMLPLELVQPTEDDLGIGPEQGDDEEGPDDDGGQGAAQDGGRRGGGGGIDGSEG